MTKPSEFILNSDYLSFAQTNKDTNIYTAYFPAVHYDPGYPYDRDRDFTVSSSPGAIDIFMISVNNSPWYLAGCINLEPDNWLFIKEVYAYRLNATTIRVKFHTFTSQTGGQDVPEYTIRLKVSSFKPPDVF